MATNFSIKIGKMGICSELWAICNQCLVMAAPYRKTLKYFKEFLRFFCKNDPLW